MQTTVPPGAPTTTGGTTQGNLSTNCATTGLATSDPGANNGGGSGLNGCNPQVVVSGEQNDRAAQQAARVADAQRNQAQAQPAPPSEFQRMVADTLGRPLPIFGDSLFNDVPSTFAPVTDVPVGPSYVLGPGDELNVQLSGSINQQLRLTIDRTGSISVPGIGSVHVAGLAYGELNRFLTEQLNKIYRNFTVNAELGSLREIQVFVVGQARRPGSYSISSLSTLTNAIFASGGPLPQGSLRNIEVKRGGVTIDHFDMYDLLLRGDKTKDIPLATGDVIFIPFVGPQVAIAGSIDTPAIYELKGGEQKGETTVAQALALAGGETATAEGESVQLQRVYDHSMRSIEDVARDGNTVTVKNGDILTVRSVIDRFKNAVTLRGNVANPGRYVWHPGMHLSDLIPNKDALITRNYWRQRNLLGQTAPEYQPENTTQPTPAEGSLQVKGSQAQQQADARATSRNSASTSGDSGGSSVGVALTGNSGPFTAKTDVILSAPDIYWSYAVIERQSTANLTTSLIPFDLGKLVMDGDASQNLELLPGDVVTIFSKADIRVPSSIQTKFVRLEGEFNAAGVYSVLPGETLRGLLRRVGGFTPEAYLYASEFTRESTRRVEQQRLQEYADQLEAQISATTSTNQAHAVTPADQLAATASQTDAQNAVTRLRGLQPVGRIVLDLKPNSEGIDAVPDIPLEDGDRFVVPRVPANVTVQGQVYNANAFLYTPDERVINYLKRAGGPDRQADKKRMFVLRADGSVVSRQYADVAHAQIFPGDTIVVPPILDKRSTLQRVLDISQIIGSVGVGVATLAILAGN
jgi:polysaccharide export outer membrane protein